MLCLQSGHLGHAGARLHHLVIPDGSKPAANITTLVLWNQCWLWHPFRGQRAWPPTHRFGVLRIGTKTSWSLKQAESPQHPCQTELPQLQAFALPRGQTHHGTAELCLHQAVSTSALSRAAAMLLAGRLLLKGIKSHLEMGWLVLLACYLVHGVRFALSIFVLLR